MTKHKPEVKSVEVDKVEDRDQMAEVVEAKVPTEVAVVEKVDTKSTKRKYRFEVISGTHYVGDEAQERGAVIESDDDLVAEFGNNKFRRVE